MLSNPKDVSGTLALITIPAGSNFHYQEQGRKTKWAAGPGWRTACARLSIRPIWFRAVGGLNPAWLTGLPRISLC